MKPQIERLRAIHRLESGGEMDEYDRLIAELANDEPLDPSLLPDLFLSFYDDTKGEQVMWALLHLVEDFPSEAYARALVGALPGMVTQAKGWAILLLMRLLNSATDRPLLRQAYFAGSSDEKSLLRDLLHEIVRDKPAFTNKVEEVTAPE